MGYINNPSVSNVMPSTPTASANGSATRQRRKEARPGELLDAALDLFRFNDAPIFEALHTHRVQFDGDSGAV